MAVVLPKGKSLDECAEMTQRRTQGRAAKDGIQPGRPKRRRKPKVSTGGSRTVFDFLNHKLGDKSSGPAEGGAAVQSGATGVEAYRAGKSTKRSLNVKLFQAAERVAQTEREIQKLSESLGRQTSRSVQNMGSVYYLLHFCKIWKQEVESLLNVIEQIFF
ncbi:hypothetical protein XENOCAPTIV_005997 [Xenoophorus captivus]|uniref:Uncharacterized protein n=1 Tax=Xenoophorus captivus TaxID=1517983 RepID=A0ABV0RC50_9TELE